MTGAGGISLHLCLFNNPRKETVPIEHPLATIMGRLSDPKVADYFSRNTHRMAACRAMLELLQIPLPDWAERDISGRAAARRNVLAASKADIPEPPNYKLAPRKPNASPERVAEAKGQLAAKLFG